MAESHSYKSKYKRSKYDYLNLDNYTMDSKVKDATVNRDNKPSPLRDYVDKPREYETYEYYGSLDDYTHFPVFFRKPTVNEYKKLENLCDAIHIESIDEALYSHKHEKYDIFELARFYENISKRLQEYHNHGKPIFYTRTPKDSGHWEKFKNFCKNINQFEEEKIYEGYNDDNKKRQYKEFCRYTNIKYEIGKIIDILEGGNSNVYLLDEGRYNWVSVKPLNSNNAIIEIGGHYGSACVWQIARSADFVITSVVPDSDYHPNYPPQKSFTNAFAVKKAFINPAITQGHGCIRIRSDELCHNISNKTNHYVVFPKFKKSAVDNINNVLREIYLKNKEVTIGLTNQDDESEGEFYFGDEDRLDDNPLDEGRLEEELVLGWDNSKFYEIFNQYCEKK